MLTPCSPCLCSGAPCEQCMFGYRSDENNHRIMKNMFKTVASGENALPYEFKLVEKYKNYHTNWKEQLGDYLLEDVDRKEYRMKDALLVSIVNDILIVAKKGEGEVPQIVNAFQGEEAKALYNKLVTVSKNE